MNHGKSLIDWATAQPLPLAILILLVLAMGIMIWKLYKDNQALHRTVADLGKETIEALVNNTHSNNSLVEVLRPQGDLLKELVTLSRVSPK